VHGREVVPATQARICLHRNGCVVTASHGRSAPRASPLFPVAEVKPAAATRAQEHIARLDVVLATLLLQSAVAFLGDDTSRALT